MNHIVSLRSVQKLSVSGMRYNCHDESKFIIHPATSHAQQSRFIKLPFNGGFQLSRIKDINYLVADGNYSTVVLADASRFIISKPLKSLQKIMGKGFLRIHHSYIVRETAIKSVVCKDNTTVCELTCATSIPVSRRKKQALLDAISM